MNTRHFLIGGVAIVALPSPPVLRAHSEEPFFLAEEFQPLEVRVRDQYIPGQTLFFPRHFFQYDVFDTARAIRYGVCVGSAGLAFRGSAIIERKAERPSWRPTNDMIRRDPNRYARVANGIPRGINNPLGAKAPHLYRDGYDTYCSVQGTMEPWSMGQSVSNDCIRMLNDHVIQLYEQVPGETPVFVL